MPHAEEKQQQSTFGPCAQNSRTNGGNEHQKVNFKSTFKYGFDCFFGGVETTKEISPDVQRQAYPRGESIHEREAKTNSQQYSRKDRENQLRIFAKKAAMGIFMFYITFFMFRLLFRLLVFLRLLCFFDAA
jgi:hypothetical protein